MTDTAPIIPTPIWTAAVKGRFWLGTDHVAIRHREAMILRELGHTYQEIALRLNFGDRMAAYYAVNHSAIAQEMRAKRPEIAHNARNDSEGYPETCTPRTDDTGDSAKEAA